MIRFFQIPRGNLGRQIQSFKRLGVFGFKVVEDYREICELPSFLRLATS